MPDGSMVRFRCIDPVKGYQDYVEILTKAGVVPKQGLVKKKSLSNVVKGQGTIDSCACRKKTSPLSLIFPLLILVPVLVLVMALFCFRDYL